MKTISAFKYKVFFTSEQFESWQVEKEVVIHQIQPLILGLNMEFENTSADAGTRIGIFIVYSEKEVHKRRNIFVPDAAR